MLKPDRQNRGIIVNLQRMITLIIILITAGVSILCFTGRLDINAWVFNAYQVWHRKQWHRMLSYGLVHSGWGHLIFNMLTLYFFGPVVEQYFGPAFGTTAGGILFAVLYVSAIAVSTIGDLLKYKPSVSVLAQPEGPSLSEVNPDYRGWTTVLGLTFLRIIGGKKF